MRRQAVYLLLFLTQMFIFHKTVLTSPKIQDVKIVMIIASSNFRDEEYQIPREIFEKEGAKIVIASSSLSTSVGMFGKKVNPDILLDDINVRDFDVVVFVGGSGTKEYFENKKAHQIARDAINEKKILAAICLAPVILGKAGILKGKKATVWEGAKDEILKCGAKYISGKVVVDGNIITAPGPEFAKKFAEKILERIHKGRKQK